MGKLFEELKRRRVYRVAGVYTVVAWILIQVADTVMPALQMPEWTVSFVTIMFMLGFPIALVLAWAFQITPEGIVADTGESPRREVQSKDSTLLYATFALVLVVAGFQITDRFLASSPETQRPQSVSTESPLIVRSSIDLGTSVQQPILNLYHEFTFSPDGSQLAYTILDESGVSIEVRDLADGTSRTALEQGGPFTPQFSPGGDLILYADITTAGLHIVPASGGRSRQLTRVANLAMGANWLDEQTIVYANAADGALHALSINGGDPQPLAIPLQPGERLSWPTLTSDGEWLIYCVTTASDFYESRIDAFNLNDGTSKNLIQRGFHPSYAQPGYVVFLRDENLWAALCNPANDDECILEAQLERDIAHHRVLGAASYGISSSGVLIFHQKSSAEDASGDLARVSELLWKTLDGEDIPHNLPQTAYISSYSPTGTHVAFNLRNSDGGRDIGIYNIADRTIQRRSFTGDARSALWSADGQRLVYSVSNGNGSDLWITNADGSGQARRLVSSGSPLRANSFSPDDSVLVFTEGIPDVRRLKTLSLTGSEIQIDNLLPEESIQAEGIISPDGRWIAYTSRELGEFDIFVRPYPLVNDGKWQVTYGGGIDPLWTADSTKLYYLDIKDDSIYRVSVTTEPTFSTQAPEKLTGEISWSIANQRHFTISPDGEQLIYIQSFNPLSIRASSLVLVTGWFERLKQMIGTN